MHYGTACQLEHLFDSTSTQDTDQDQRRSRSLMQVGGAPTVVAPWPRLKRLRPAPKSPPQAGLRNGCNESRTQQAPEAR
jgi:hypothetical protein